MVNFGAVLNLGHTWASTYLIEFTTQSGTYHHSKAQEARHTLKFVIAISAHRGPATKIAEVYTTSVLHNFKGYATNLGNWQSSLTPTLKLYTGYSSQVFDYYFN